SSSERVNIGTKAELKAPSANSRRNRFGNRNATRNASDTAPVPSAAAMNMSRMKPSARLDAVAPPTVTKLRSSDIVQRSNREGRMVPCSEAAAQLGLPRRGPHWKALLDDMSLNRPAETPDLSVLVVNKAT